MFYRHFMLLLNFEKKIDLEHKFTSVLLTTAPVLHSA